MIWRAVTLLSLQAHDVRRPSGRLRGAEHTTWTCPTERRDPIVSRVRHAMRLRFVPCVVIRMVCHVRRR